jgi:hypothetical protein
MWGTIILVVLALIVISYPLEWFLARGMRRRKTNSQNYLGRDVAPMIGFLALLLLGLSFAEAARRDVLYAWAWGSGFGLVVTFCIWIAYKQTFRSSAPTGRPRESTLRIVLRVFRTYGIFLLLVFFALNVAMRFLGPMGVMVEVFVASALGASVIGLALVLVARARQQTSNNQK